MGCEKPNEVRAWFGCLLVLAIFTLARPYVGLRHDGVLYLGQTLLHADALGLATDLAFRYGSQDQFTVVTRLLALLYRHVELAQAQIAFVVLTQLAILATLWRWLSAAGLGWVERWLAMVAVVAMSHVYGGHGLFAFSERFVTSRMLGEPLALFGLYLLWAGRIAPALLTLIAASLVHPLVTLPVLAVGWLLLLQRDRRWAWCALALPAAALLGGLGLQPFPLLFERYDAEWWTALAVSNLGVFPSNWPLVDWMSVLADTALLGAAGRVLTPRLAPLSRALVIATGLLFGITIVGADLAHNVLVTQVQLWRIHWLLHALALALLPATLIRVWSHGRGGRLAAVAIATAFVGINGRFDPAWALVLWAGLACAVALRPTSVSPRTLALTTGAAVTALLGVSLVVGQQNLDLFRYAGIGFDLNSVALFIFTLPTCTGVLAVAAIAAHRSARVARWTAAAAVAVFATYGATHWDRRPPWIRIVETGVSGPRVFQQQIPLDAQVYWGDEAAALWVLVRRASYLSSYQGTGLVFNRDMAIEHQRRYKILQPAYLQRELCQMLGALGVRERDQAPCWPTLDVAARVCSAAGGPDFMILEHALARGKVAEHTFRGEQGYVRTVHLHDCRQVA